MPLNVRSAERRTGYQIVALYGPGDGDLMQTGWVARDSGAEVARAYAKLSTDGLVRDSALLAALESLCDDIYDLHRAIVLERSQGRCERCGDRKPLTAHHIKFRSHGRLDVVQNLLACCIRCHSYFHGIRLQS